MDNLEAVSAFVGALFLFLGSLVQFRRERAMLPDEDWQSMDFLTGQSMTKFYGVLVLGLRSGATRRELERRRRDVEAAATDTGDPGGDALRTKQAKVADAERFIRALSLTRGWFFLVVGSLLVVVSTGVHLFRS